VAEDHLDAGKRRQGSAGRLSKDNGPADPVYSDGELVHRSQQGDEWAMEQLIRRYQQKVFRIAYQICSADEDAAKESTQDAFLNAFLNIKKFKGNATFYTWLYRITVNTCIDARRRHKRWRRTFSTWRKQKSPEKQSATILEEYPGKDGNPNPLSQQNRQQLEIDVKKALKGLSDKQRTVFQLKVFQELSIHDIADIMGLAEGTVKSHLFRATQFIQSRLAAWIEH